MQDTQKTTNDHLKNINLSDQNFHTIFQSQLSELDIIYLSFNNSLTTKQIAVLFERDIVNANINLLRNPLCSLEYIKQFLKKQDKIYNIAIASNEALPYEIFKTLLNYNDFDVDIAIAFNPNAPKEILETLHEKGDAQINLALKQNGAIEYL